jgi:hypothetical protein
MNSTGLTEDQAKEFHAAFMKYFILSALASTVAHTMVGFSLGGWSFFG